MAEPLREVRCTRCGQPRPAGTLDDCAACGQPAYRHKTADPGEWHEHQQAALDADPVARALAARHRDRDGDRRG